MSDAIELNIPSKLEYISIVRLAASSIANTLNFNVDEIEDIKVCISEACVNILNFTDSKEINIVFSLRDDGIYIDIKDTVEEIPEGIENEKQGKMGLLIISSLMDKVEFKDDAISMIKYVQ